MSVNTQNINEMYEFLFVVEWTEEATNKWLDTIIEKNLYNQKNTDTLDYERLIYSESIFADNKEIMDKINLVKQHICRFYKIKKQLLASCSSS